ncbi:Arc family DNA-binding protein [Variovorax sp. HJSM1_2]|uniref:Arc family DNA-binding protein n=1 Tax=Variovorax sp. HJSM1_2 TaxID=3366263 RepID=UPI003BC10D41
MEKETFKAREVQPTVLRLHPDMREELMRLAKANGRSLSKEIAVRLEESLKEKKHAAPPMPSQQLRAQEKSLGGFVSETDQAMLDVFHSLPPKKQLALLSLFEG